MTMNVAMITPWNVRCGIYTYTKNLSQSLADQGTDVYIVRLPRFGLKTKELLESNVAAKIPVDKIDLIHCFPSGTSILTTNGVKNIEDVTQQDCLYTHTGKIGTIVNRFRRPYVGKVLSITAKYNDSVKCTPEHPFLIIKKPWKDNHTTRLFRKRIRERIDKPDLKPRWVPANEIEIGDYVVMPRLKQLGQIAYIEPELNLPTWFYQTNGEFVISKSRKARRSVMQTKIPITESVCRLLGLYIAEGSSQRTSIRFSLNAKEKTLVEDIENLMMFVGCENKPSINIEGNGLCMAFSSRPLAHLFRELCGSGARNKHLPSWWLALNDNCLAELLKGIWLGDGCIQSDGFSITSYSQTLREQLRLAYNRLGIVAGVHPTSVRVCGAGIKQLEILWKIKHPATSKFNFRDFAEINDDFITYRVCAKKEEDYCGDVFNFEINSDNSYLVRGYTAHNCQHEYGLYQNLSSSFYEALKTLGKPVVTTMHSVGNWDDDIFISKGSNRIIVHNEFCARRLGYPTVIIPHGAKPAQRVPQDKAKKSLGAPLPMDLVGYCGFITNFKGLEALIEAMTKVPRAGLLIGGGYHTEESTGYINQLKQETLDKLPGRCQWLGYVSEEDLARVYASMDIVVYPSRFSTESGALIMALSHGKAVIASNVAPFREKEKLGVLTTFKDVLDLTKKIKKLLKNESLRHEYERKAYEYSEKTSWTNIAKLHQSLYEDVLRNEK